MRLKMQLSSYEHTGPITGLDWLNKEEIITASDDHEILRWSNKMEAFSLTQQRKECNMIYPTSLQLTGNLVGGETNRRQNPSTTIRSSPLNSGANELILLSASDGKIHLINISGKIEKSIEAHKGAVILAKWSNAEPAGAGGFASCGEDGCVKMWSKTGMLRSVLAQAGKSVYALDWNANSSKLVYCTGEECFIITLNTQTSPLKWHAHSGLVLCVAWSCVNNQIVTGGEDCRYRLWDCQGRPLWSSASHGFPVNAVAWSPDGEMFAIGAFNLLRLCDRSGWSHSLERPNCGTIYSLSWSADSTQLAGGCASGQLLHAHIIEKRMMWEQLEAVQTKRKTINIRDLNSEVARERLETRDRVIRIELGFDFLVVATIKQCYIFSAKNWNTPIVTDLKEGVAGLVTLIRLCPKCFLLADSQSVQVWNYEGRIMSTIRLPSSAQFGESFNEQTAAIANDLVVLRDKTEQHLIHLFDPKTGRTTGDGQITHSANITELCVNQCGGIADRHVAFVDINGDCFIALVNSYGATKRTIKIGSLISCLKPNNATNMLAAFQDNHRLLVWTIPMVAFLDRDLLSKTKYELGNGAELGRSSTIVGFIGNTITVRRSDGCMIAHYMPPFIAGIINSVHHNQWDHAVRICRAIKEDFLWASLAGLAISQKNYTVAEICYGNLHEAEKVIFLNELRNQPNGLLRSAQMAQFGGNSRETDAALIKFGHYFEAIMFNLGIFRFERALELAMKSGSHLDTVLGYRQRYLELLGRKENDPKFLKHLTQVEIDWQHIFDKILEDEQKIEQQQHQHWGLTTNSTAGGLDSPN